MRRLSPYTVNRDSRRLRRRTNTWPSPTIPIKSARVYLLAGVCVVVAALYLAQDFLVPLALAILFSFLLAPLVRRLEKLKLPRVAAVMITVCVAFAVLGGIGFVVYSQMSDLARQLRSIRTTSGRR